MNWVWTKFLWPNWNPRADFRVHLGRYIRSNLQSPNLVGLQPQNVHYLPEERANGWSLRSNIERYKFPSLPFSEWERERERASPSLLRPTERERVAKMNLCCLLMVASVINALLFSTFSGNPWIRLRFH